MFLLLSLELARFCLLVHCLLTSLSFSKHRPFLVRVGSFLSHSLSFIESYNFYGVTKDNNIISVKLYDNLIGESSKRLTKDKEWILID